jgi:hypothetical protein
MNATKKFQKWATGFSGCDGGNLHGSVWFCGIEWGTGKDHDLAKEMNLSVSEAPQIYETPGEILNYPLGIKLIKLIAAMRGGAVQDYHQVAFETPFPFHRKSDYFKLNLFPVAFRKVDPQLWVDMYSDLTGLSTRNQYLEWCRGNRFPRMRSWMERGQPKLIVGIGSSCVDEFQAAFGFRGVGIEETIEGRKLLWMSNGNAILAVIPFLGQFQLDSDRRIQAFGERLGAIQANTVGSDAVTLLAERVVGPERGSPLS